MQHLLVSIIMPVYNTQQFLKEAVDSVLNQDYEPIELILVNDGSTDDSAKTCVDFAEKYPHITFLDQPNQGVSVARNNGFSLASGQYVFFMDSDDTIAPDFISTCVEKAQSEDYELLLVGEDYSSRLPHPTALPTCAQFWKTDFLKKYPFIRFPEGIQPGEDGLFSHMLLALNPRLGYNGNGNYHYRKHAHQNHKHILKDGWKIIYSIPDWFALLTKFYKEHDLYSTKALHLAKFVEHEPFELRFLNLGDDSEQKEYLFELIHQFMDKYVCPNLEQMDDEKLSERFKLFLKATDAASFDRQLNQYLTDLTKKKAKALFFVKFIPISSIRRKMRLSIYEKYHLV